MGEGKITLPAELDDVRERKLIGELLDVCGFRGMHHVVDYGCGRGRWIWPLIERCELVTGVDCDQNYLDTIASIARLNNRTVQLINASDLRPVADRSVDGIISIGTLPVVRTGDLWHDFFEQASRVLRPNGRILFNTFSRAMVTYNLTSFEALRYIPANGWRYSIDREIGWIIQWLRSFRHTIDRGRHYYATDTSAVEQLLNIKGFRMVMGTDDLMRQSPVALLPAYPNNPTNPHHHWWLVTKS